jgi:hypothetical protein
MPHVASDITGWQRFFELVLRAEDRIREVTVDWHRVRIKESRLQFEPPDRLWIFLNDLAASLLLYGYSTDELFNRAKDFVLDASELQEGTPRERLLKYLDYFLDREERVYVVWTPVVADTPWETAALQRRFSGLTLEAPWHLRGTDPRLAYVRENGQKVPMILSRVDGTHGVAQRHRFQALQLLDDLMSREKSLGHLVLGAKTSMTLLSDFAKGPWTYSRRPYALPELDGANTPHGAQRLARSAQQLFDRPVTVIDEVFQILEHAKANWGNMRFAYTGHLRNDLGSAIHAYRCRFEGLYRKLPPSHVSSGVRYISNVSGIRDHERLLTVLRAEAPEADPAFLYRLHEVVDWHNGKGGNNADPYDKASELPDLLVLARGFRNALHHTKPMTFDVYPIALDLAIGMLYNYSAWVR